MVVESLFQVIVKDSIFARLFYHSLYLTSQIVLVSSLIKVLPSKKRKKIAMRVINFFKKIRIGKASKKVIIKKNKKVIGKTSKKVIFKKPQKNKKVIGKTSKKAKNKKKNKNKKKKKTNRPKK